MAAAERVAGDLGRIADALDQLDAPAAAALLAAGVGAEAPRVTGYLARSVATEGPLVVIAAPYAAAVAARNPFIARGADRALDAATDAAYAPVETALNSFGGTYK